MTEERSALWIKCVLCVCAATCLCTLLGASSGKCGIRLEPEKTRISSGEPLAIKIVLFNDSDRTVTLDTGPGGVAAFGFSIVDKHLGKVCEWRDVPQSGMQPRGRLELESGQQAQKFFVVNKWCQMRVQPGTYEIQVSYADFRDQSLVFSDKSSIVIEPYDEQAIQRAITKAYDGISKSYDNGPQLRMLVEKIAYSQYSGAVDYISKILQDKAIFFFIKKEAVLGLGGICTERAARVLETVIGDEELRGEVLQAAKRMRQNLDPGVADYEIISNVLQTILDLDPSMRKRGSR